MEREGTERGNEKGWRENRMGREGGSEGERQRDIPTPCFHPLSCCGQWLKISSGKSAALWIVSAAQQLCSARYGTVQYSTVVQYNTVQYSIIQCSTVE